MSIDIGAMAKQAAAQTDYTKVSTGGDFKKEIPEAGKGLARLREYIEIGMHETKSALYPNKKPQRKCRFVFELVTPKHLQVFKAGEADEFKRPHCISIEVIMSDSEKSNFIKLFKQLNYAQTAVHPAQLLGASWLVDIVHAWKKGDDPKKDVPSYANLQKDGTYTFAAPRIEDPMSGTVTEIAVPDFFGGRDSMKIFLYDQANKECWDSLFIAGTYEKDGKEQSKNWLQEKILSALDYPGSNLEEMILSGDGTGLGELPTQQLAWEGPEEPGTPDPLAKLGL